MKYRLTTGILILIVLAAVSLKLFFSYHKSSSSGPTQVIVTLTSAGFTPAEITIRQGQTITFVTNLDRPFWPASDFHPTHNLYPEFDPKKPISKNSSWTFTFNKSGKWTYHDHLLPSEGGAIIVLNKDGVAENNQAACSDQPNRPQCWLDSIDFRLKNDGLAAAFKEVELLYSTQPKFAEDCHGYAHKLGEAAYILLSQNKDVVLPASASYCGYGFYHGFMEKLLLNANDMTKAGDFCSSIYQQQNITSGDACYHGIGHGAEALAVSDPGVWGEPKQMFSKALSVCSIVSKGDQIKNSRCASGVFMEASSYYADNTYQLTYDKTNPSSICADQEDNVKLNCYTQLYPVLKALAGYDFAKAAKFVEEIKEDSFAEESIETLSGSSINVQAKDHKRDIAVCRSLQERLRLSCIKGLAVGFLLNSTPGQEFEKTSQFCKSSGLSNDEEKSCYDVALRQVSQTYTAVQLTNYCREVAPAYKNEVCK